MRPWARSAAWRLGVGGRQLGRAGTLAAGMWIAGVGARMVFYFAATYGAGPAIAAFSIAAPTHAGASA